MKTIKDKELVVGADFAGYPLKEAVVKHLREKGWKITDMGVKSPEDNDPELMFHRIGLRVGAMISEREFERALLFCGYTADGGVRTGHGHTAVSGPVCRVGGCRDGDFCRGGSLIFSDGQPFGVGDGGPFAVFGRDEEPLCPSPGIEVQR